MGPQNSSNHRLRIILSGFLLDLLDFILRGPIGLYFGFPTGCIIGILLGRYIGLTWAGSGILGIASGIYCTIPGTFFLPLGTLVAVLNITGSRKDSIDGSPPPLKENGERET